jgi:hypothetical protein
MSVFEALQKLHHDTFDVVKREALKYLAFCTEI